MFFDGAHPAAHPTYSPPTYNSASYIFEVRLRVVLRRYRQAWRTLSNYIHAADTSRLYLFLFVLIGFHKLSSLFTREEAVLSSSTKPCTRVLIVQWWWALAHLLIQVWSLSVRPRMLGLPAYFLPPLFNTRSLSPSACRISSLGKGNCHRNFSLDYGVFIHSGPRLLDIRPIAWGFLPLHVRNMCFFIIHK